MIKLNKSQTLILAFGLILFSCGIEYIITFNHHSNWSGLEIINYLLGFALIKIIQLFGNTYIIKIILERIHTQLEFFKILHLVTIAFSILLLSNIILIILPELDYSSTRSIQNMSFFTGLAIITVGLHLKAKVKIGHAIFISIFMAIVYFLALAPFMGIRVKINPPQEVPTKLYEPNFSE